MRFCNMKFTCLQALVLTTLAVCSTGQLLRPTLSGTRPTRGPWMDPISPTESWFERNKPVEPVKPTHTEFPIFAPFPIRKKPKVDSSAEVTPGTSPHGPGAPRLPGAPAPRPDNPKLPPANPKLPPDNPKLPPAVPENPPGLPPRDPAVKSPPMYPGSGPGVDPIPGSVPPPRKPAKPTLAGPDVAVQNRMPGGGFMNFGSSHLGKAASNTNSVGKTTGIVIGIFSVALIVGIVASVVIRRQARPISNKLRRLSSRKERHYYEPPVQLSYAPRFM